VTKTLKRLDLLLREVQDPHAQENFWRLKRIFEDLETSGLAGPTGPQGPTGPMGPSGAAAIIFTSDAGTVAGDLVRVNAANTVTKITDNVSATIPHGVFGVCYSKPTATSAEVIFGGVIGSYAGFTTGSALFVSALGVPTHVPPTTGMVQQIGFAVSTTEMLVNLLQPIRRM
jgi:hypothetical protein